jgi:hypothetical protein
MNQNDNQLVCTFFEFENKRKVLDDIIERYVLLKENVYLVKTDDKRYFYTYNVNKKEAYNSKMKRTILVHRKQETNTIFTINSLNELQKQINNGVEVQHTNINWENYKNKLLLFSNNLLTINTIEVVDIVRVKYVKN